jgi:biotin carboxylase
MVMPWVHLAQRAVEEGFELYSLWDPNRETAQYIEEVRSWSAALHLVDADDETALRDALIDMARRYDVGRIIHLAREDTMLATYAVAETIGLQVNPATAIESINDKAATRRLLRARGLSPVHAVELPSADDVAGRLAEFDLPVVLKPTRMAGSRAVRLVSDPASLDAWRAAVAGYGYDGPVLIEEFLRGPEYSVETLTVDGRHHVFGVTAKRVTPPPRFVEVGHVFPAPIPAAERDAIVASALAFLDAAGLRFGPAHTEVIVTASGPRIVESQARMAGDMIPLLVQLATGVDYYRAPFQALAGRPVPAPTLDRVAAIAYFQFRPGVLDRVTGLDAVDALPFVRRWTFPFAPGDPLPDFIDGKSRHGFVVVDGADHAEVAERAAAAIALVSADSTPVEPSSPLLAGGRAAR